MIFLSFVFVLHPFRLYLLLRYFCFLSPEPLSSRYSLKRGKIAYVCKKYIVIRVYPCSNVIHVTTTKPAAREYTCVQVLELFCVFTKHLTIFIFSMHWYTRYVCRYSKKLLIISHRSELRYMLRKKRSIRVSKKSKIDSRYICISSIRIFFNRNVNCG